MSRAKSEANNFVRALTEEQLNEYKNIKGAGSAQRKKEFRDMLNNQRFKYCKSMQENTRTDTQADTQVGVYRSYWQMVEKEGGAMNKEFAMDVSNNIASCCEKVGPPFLMYDKAAKIVRYLHCEQGKSDIQTRARSSILSGEAEVDPEIIQRAMQQAESEGLSSDIPADAMKSTDAKNPSESLASAQSPCDRQVPKQTDPKQTDQKQTGPNQTDQKQTDPKLSLIDLYRTVVSKGDAQGEKAVVTGMLIQELMGGGKGEEVKNDNDEPAKADAQGEKPQEPKEKRLKTHVETVWQKCVANGSKLQTMVAHTQSVIGQCNNDESDWSWAKSQVETIQKPCQEVLPVLAVWSSNVSTSSLPQMQRKQGDAIVPFLETHLKDIEVATTKLEQPLGVLTAMHRVMLQKLNTDKQNGKRDKKGTTKNNASTKKWFNGPRCIENVARLSCMVM